MLTIHPRRFGALLLGVSVPLVWIGSTRAVVHHSRLVYVVADLAVVLHSCVLSFWFVRFVTGLRVIPFVCTMVVSVIFLRRGVLCFCTPLGLSPEIFICLSTAAVVRDILLRPRLLYHFPRLPSVSS